MSLEPLNVSVEEKVRADPIQQVVLQAGKLKFRKTKVMGSYKTAPDHTTSKSYSLVSALIISSDYQATVHCVLDTEFSFNSS